MPSIILRQSSVISDPLATIKGSPLLNSEIDNNFANINISIGNLNNLSTLGKSNIVISINEVSSNIGLLSDLITSNTGNLVFAINEIKQNVNTSIVVEASRLVDNSITSAKLAPDSIISEKIADSNITTSKLADDSITTSKLADSSITTSKLADDSITTSKIVNNSVTTAKIASTGVVAALYGNATRIPQITVGSDGRITSLSNVEISGAGFTNLNADSITSGTLVAERGGTAQSSWTTGQMLYASGINTLAKLAIGTSGQILSVSAGGIPAWINDTAGVSSVDLSGGTTGLLVTGGPILSSGTMTLSGTLAVANGGTGSTSTTYCSLTTNVSGTLPIVNGGTGTSSTAYCSLTTNVSGTLPAIRGGTGFDQYTAGQILYASSTTALTRLGIGTEGHFLKVVGGVPQWAPVTGTGITSLGVLNQGSSLGLTIQSDVGSTITSTGTLSLSLNQATFRSQLGLGSMATQDTSILNSYATTSALSSYAPASALSSYASLGNNNAFNGTNTFNGAGNYYSDHRFYGKIRTSTGFGSTFSSGAPNPSDYWNAFFQSQVAHPAVAVYAPGAGSVGVAIGCDTFNLGQLNYEVYYYGTPNAPGNNIGGVFSSTGNSVNFATTSDYRLKTDIVTLTGAIARIKQLNPVKFKWKSNLEFGYQDGFLAHEVEPVVPEAITGEKDAVDDKGNIRAQQMDASYLIPLLTASLKEAIARIETLEAQVASLQG